MADTEWSINLIVEDGRGIPAANSYVSSEYADAYAKNRNYDTWLSQTDYVKKAAVIKAMDYVDNLFDWKGRKMYRDQPLSFPRVNITDRDGFDREGYDCIGYTADGYDRNGRNKDGRTREEEAL